MKRTLMNDEYLQLIGMPNKQYKQVELDCEICNRHDFELILNKGRIARPGQYGPISILQCRHCGHVMLNPRYEAQFYIDYYRKFYRDIANFGGENPKDAFLERQIERGEAVRRFLAKRHRISRGSMLDAGCSCGATMVPFRDNGWNIHGIDPDKGSVEFGKRVLHLPILFGGIEHLTFNADSMDLVILLGTLGHVYDFHAAMNELSRVLRKGGHLFIRIRHNRPWGLIWEYFNANHYRFFCEQTLRLAMLRYGFEVLEYINEEIEGIPGHQYLLCRNMRKPSLERVEQAISQGLKDSPEILKEYLAIHHREFVKGAKELIDFVERRCSGDLSKACAEIDQGNFECVLLDGERSEAIKRALLEAKQVLRGRNNYERRLWQTFISTA